MLWIGIAACGSTLLLAMTNQVCQDVAVTPVFWVIPLALYLVSFIVCFAGDGTRGRSLWTACFAVSVLFLGRILERNVVDRELDLGLQMLVYCSVLFSGCCICHGELARLKPSADRATGFYLSTAFGGALGGVFVGLVAPSIFDDYWEFAIALVGTAGVAAARMLVERRGSARVWAVVQGGVGVLILGAILSGHFSRVQRHSLATVRSFYGVLRVQEAEYAGKPGRALSHGVIHHGFQWLDAELSRNPVSYYGPRSGVGIALKVAPTLQPSIDSPLHIGVVGLGVGTLAAFGRAQDTMRFYEVDPQVAAIADTYFTYLSDSPAEIEVVLGDARSQLEAEWDGQGSQGFDLLVLDAFSGDAIPTHLLTREAMDLYWRHLAAHGTLALHISNLYVDLRDVIRSDALARGVTCLMIGSSADAKTGADSCDWVLLSHDDRLEQSDAVRREVDEWNGSPSELYWTDDFHSLLEVLR